MRSVRLRERDGQDSLGDVVDGAHVDRIVGVFINGFAGIRAKLHKTAEESVHKIVAIAESGLGVARYRSWPIDVDGEPSGAHVMHQKLRDVLGLAEDLR